MKRTILIAALAFALLSIKGVAQSAFEGSVIVEWLEEEGPDRKMRLQEPISFTDADGKKWTVPKGWIIDGASIPKIFWTTIGPPFVGDYRRASVIHDYYCDTKTESWRSVHKMFRNAAIAGGASESQANVMWAAIYAGGPRWKTIKTKISNGFVPLTTTQTISSIPTFNEKAFENIAERIADGQLTFEEARVELDRITESNLPEDSGAIVR